MARNDLIAFFQPAGPAAAAASAPVVLATEQAQDLFITGAAAQSVLGNNILLAAAGTAAIDTVAPGSNAPSYRAFSIEVAASAGISAGQIIFEDSNDNVHWLPVPFFQDATGAYPLTVAVNVAASANMHYTGVINQRYFRARISTAFVGGTIQAFTRLMIAAPPPRLIAAVQSNPAFLAMTNTPVAPTGHVLTTAATTNATSMKNSAGNLFSITVTNPTATPAFLKLYNKASAPTVGTDVPVATFPIPATAATPISFGPLGQRLTTGIAYAITGAIADSDTSNTVAGIHVMASYS